MQAGKASIRYEEPPLILAAASVAGQKEGQGPLGQCFDRIAADPMLGKKTWEEAESQLQLETAKLCLQKAGLKKDDIRYLFAGDLLGQIVATSFGVQELEIPLFGLYGACSTMGEAMSLASMAAAAGYGDRVMAMASSHFASAERQFRFPLAYGNQRPFSATWTVTGCGCVVIGSGDGKHADGKHGAAPVGLPPHGGNSAAEPYARIAGVTTGKIVDMQCRDSMNMGAAMAVAAVDTILQNFRDLDVDETWYDRIITGDLGAVGQNIVFDFMKEAGHDVRGIHMDCGMEIFDPAAQDTHSGGSGCGCSAVTLCGHILPRLQSGEWKRVLFVPTGALLSQVSFNEGQPVPGIAHGLVLEHVE